MYHFHRAWSPPPTPVVGEDFTVTVTRITGLPTCTDQPGTSGAAWRDTDDDDCTSCAANGYCENHGDSPHPQGHANNKCCLWRRQDGRRGIGSSARDGQGRLLPCEGHLQGVLGETPRGHCDDLAFDSSGAAVGWFAGRSVERPKPASIPPPNAAGCSSSARPAGPHEGTAPLADTAGTRRGPAAAALRTSPRPRTNLAIQS